MADDASEIEIFGDSPTTEDGLGFDNYANILLDLIGNFDADSSLTIGIHGRWGSGKTSLMMMLEERFKEDKKVKTIWFDSWAYGRDESIGLALLQQILMEFQKEWKCKRPVKNLLKGTIRLLADAALRKSTGISYKDAKDHFKRSILIKSTLRHDFKAAIDKCLPNGKLIVFIDDLDRCLPEKTIEILEVIKLFLDVPKCIFVIGVEKEVIEKGIEVRYKSEEQKIPISGQDYIEKIIQIPFVLPPIREDAMEDFIKNLGIEGAEKGYVTLVAKYTRCNPRKAKLFLNVLRIRLVIAERIGGGIEPDRSAKLFVFEYVFKEFYKDIVKYKDEYLLCKLERLARGDSDEKLERALKSSELLQKYREDGDLSSLLRDEPFFCGIDIEPYIYLSGTEASQEVTAYGESVLRDLLSGDSVKIGHAANVINELPDLEKQKFLDVVISNLKDENLHVGGNAAMALGRIGDARAVEALEEALKHKNEYVRDVAALALGEIGDAKAVEALIVALKGETASVRENAAKALGQIGDARAVEALEEALRGEASLYVRRNAAEALGRIGDSKAVEALVEVLRGGHEDVRMAAAEALGRIGDSKAVEALIRALKDEEEIVVVRGKAARALGVIGDAGAVGVLEVALKDESEDVRKYVAEALEKIKANQSQRRGASTPRTSL